MPIVRIDLLPGRTAKVKQALVDRITDAFIEICGTNPKALDILFTDVPREDWFVAGVSYGAKLGVKP